MSRPRACVSRRVVRVDVTYSCERSEKKTSASAPSPGSATSYSTSSPATASASAGHVVARRRARRADLHALDRDVQRQRRGVVQRGADRLRDPAPVRVPAVQRGLDQRRVRDRARRRCPRRPSSPPRTTTRPIRLEPSPSRTMSSASLRSAQSSASPKRSLVLGLRLDRHAARARRLQDHGVVGGELAVDARPGRTSAPRTRRAAGRAVSGVKRSVGLDEAEHRRERRRDHPRALGLRASAARCRTAARRRPRSPWRTCPSSGSPRRSRRAPYSRSSRARAGDPADHLAGVQQHADHAGRGDRDLVLAHAAGHRGRALHRARRPRSRGCRWPRWRCRSWRRSRGARPGACAPGSARTGAASTPERVKRAAETRLRRRADHQAEVHPARAASARTRRPRRGSPPGRSPGLLGHVRRASRSQRSSSSHKPLRLRPAEHQVQVLHGLRRRALPQVVDRREDDDPRPSAGPGPTRCGSSSCRARRSRPTGPVAQLDERLARVRSSNSRPARLGSRARGRHVAGHQLALGERQQVRHERDRHVAPSTPSSCSISGVCRWPSIL